jgi:hypothetical protein
VRPKTKNLNSSSNSHDVSVHYGGYLHKWKLITGHLPENTGMRTKRPKWSRKAHKPLLVHSETSNGLVENNRFRFKGALVKANRKSM